MSSLHLFAVEGIGEVTEGTRLGHLIAGLVDLIHDDVVVVASKIVAKAEGRVVAVSRDDTKARNDLIDSQSRRVLRRQGTMSVAETQHGFVCANAGVDWSNVEPDHAVLLPDDPDWSARRIRHQIRAATDIDVAVVISNSFGRAWRRGVVDVALGVAGLVPVLDLGNTVDSYGNVLETTEICVADEIASAAELVMGKVDQNPVVIARGIDTRWRGDGAVVDSVVPPLSEDLFR